MAYWKGSWIWNQRTWAPQKAEGKNRSYLPFYNPCILQMKKFGSRNSKWFTQGHKASKEWSQNSNPGPLLPKKKLLPLYHNGTNLSSEKYHLVKLFHFWRCFIIYKKRRNWRGKRGSGSVKLDDNKIYNPKIPNKSSTLNEFTDFTPQDLKSNSFAKNSKSLYDLPHHQFSLTYHFQTLKLTLKIYISSLSITFSLTVLEFWKSHIFILLHTPRTVCCSISIHSDLGKRFPSQ